jgi:hypothetical protein
MLELFDRQPKVDILRAVFLLEETLEFVQSARVAEKLHELERPSLHPSLRRGVHAANANEMHLMNSCHQISS